MWIFSKKIKLQTKIFSLTCFIFLLVVVVENINIINIVNKSLYNNAVITSQKISMQLANNPLVINSLARRSAKDEEILKHYTSELLKMSELEFIVIIDMQGIRLTHPDESKIGQHVEGHDTKDVLYGKSYVSTAKGSLGISLRTFAPVYLEGKQVGAVIVGIMSQTLNLAQEKNQLIMTWSLLAILFIAITLSILLAKSIKKALYGLEPTELAKRLEERTAIFQMVREGIVAINKEGYLTLVNDEAKRLLNIKLDYDNNFLQQSQLKISDYVPNTRLEEVMITGKPEYDREQKVEGSLIITNRTPIIVNNEVVGAIATFRDLTEVKQFAEKLTGVNSYIDALRSQSHEFMNKLHVIHGLAQYSDKAELLMYIQDVTNMKAEEENNILQMIKDSLISGFILSKFSRAREIGVKLTCDIFTEISPVSDKNVTHGLITVLGNLIDNALDAVQSQENKEVNIALDFSDTDFIIEVSDSGGGVDNNILDKIFNKNYSTKGEYRGYGLYLVRKTINEMSGNINVTTEKNKGATFTVSLPLVNIYGERTK